MFDPLCRIQFSLTIAVILGSTPSFQRKLQNTTEQLAHVNYTCLWGGDLFGDPEWDEIDDGFTVVRSCPEGTTGIISRHCVEIAEDYTMWTDPDVQCSNDLIRKRTEEVKVALQSRKVNLSHIIILLEGIKNMTRDALHHHVLFYSDMRNTSDVMIDVSNTILLLTDVTEVDDQSVLRLLEVFTDTISWLSDPETFDVWKTFYTTESMISTATELLQATEMFAENVLLVRTSPPYYDDPTAVGRLRPETLGTWTHMYAASANVEIELVVIDNYDSVHLTGLNGSTSITFPPNLKKVVANSGTVGFYRAQFSSLERLFNEDEMRPPPPPILWQANKTSSWNKGVKQPSSFIASAKVVATEDYVIARLPPKLPGPIVLTFAYTEPPMDGYRGECNFLNETASKTGESYYRWSTEGCETVEANATHVVCHCYHLTNFALVMNLYKVNYTAVHQTALMYLSYVGGTLSIAGCLLSIVTYLVCKLANERIYIHEMLAASIILAQMTFFIGFERSEYNAVCKSFAVLLHFALVAMFSWMLIEGIHLYISLVKVFHRGPLFKKYCCLGFGLPLVNVAVSFAIFYDQYAADDYCWVSTTVLFIAFVPFVSLTVLVNCVILIITLRVIVRSKTNAARCLNEDISSVKVGLKATVVLLPLLGITWCFGFLSTGHNATMVFTYLFTMCNSMQGVFFYIFHCLMNAEVQASLRRLWIRANGSTSSGGSNHSDGQNPPASPGLGAEDDENHQPNCFSIAANVALYVEDKLGEKIATAGLEKDLLPACIYKDQLGPQVICQRRPVSTISLDSAGTNVTCADYEEPSDSPPPYAETVVDDQLGTDKVETTSSAAIDSHDTVTVPEHDEVITAGNHETINVENESDQSLEPIENDAEDKLAENESN